MRGDIDRTRGGARNVGQVMARQEALAKAAPVVETNKAAQVDAESAPVEEKDPTDTRIERSRRAFLRAGWKDAEFRKLDKQEAIRRGLKLERQQNRQAEAVAKSTADAEKKGESSQAQSAGETQSRVATPPDDALLAELFTALGIDDDTEAKAALKAKLSPVLSERAQLKRALEQRSESSDANQRDRLTRVRAQAAESIPELADDDDFKSHVAPVIAALAATPRFAAASTDDAVLQDLIETSARLALEEVGESVESISEHGAPGRGFVDMKGAGGPRGAEPVDPLDVFKKSVYEEIGKMHRVAS